MFLLPGIPDQDLNHDPAITVLGLAFADVNQGTEKFPVLTVE